MNVLNSFTLIVMLFLAVWKLYDLFIGNYKKKDNLKNIKLANELYAKFMAEFTHKCMNKHTSYEPAPKEVYTWLIINFNEWLDYQSKIKK